MTTLYKLLVLQVRTGYKRLITTRKERQAVAKREVAVGN